MDVLSLSLWLIIGAIVLGAAWAYALVQRMRGTRDADASGVRSRHPVLLNPVFLAYALTVVVIAAGAVIAILWLRP